MKKTLSGHRTVKIIAILVVMAVLICAPLAGAAADTEPTAPRSRVVLEPLEWLLSLLRGLSSIDPDDGKPLSPDSTDEQSEEPTTTEPSNDPEIGPYVDPWG